VLAHEDGQLTGHERQEAAASANVDDQVILLYCRLDPLPVCLVALRVLQDTPPSPTCIFSAARPHPAARRSGCGAAGAETWSMSKW
jgi:hypothetical protein